jgi:hypothetical protein
MPHQALTRWRLAALALGVLVVHAVVLQAAASRFALDTPAMLPMPPTHAVVLPPLQTRRIEAPRPVLPLPPVTVSRPAPPLPTRPVVRQRSAPEAAAVPVEVSPPAEDSTASLPAAPPPADAPVAAPEIPPSVAMASVPTETVPPPNPVNLAPSAVLGYKMTGSAKGLDYHANAELVWRREGSHYDARMTVSVLFLGARSMSSVGEVGVDGLAPTRFTDKSRSEYAAHFEPDKGLITFSANTPPAPWVRGAQDRISVFLQLGGLLAGNPAAYPVGTTVAVYTVGPRAADTWTFRVEAEETLALPLGEVRAIKLTRLPQREYDQRVEVWLAPALGYLPVRNKITQSNGDFIDQQLSALARP